MVALVGSKTHPSCNRAMEGFQVGFQTEDGGQKGPLAFERRRSGRGCAGRKSNLCLAFERQRGDGGVWCQWRGVDPGGGVNRGWWCQNEGWCQRNVLVGSKPCSSSVEQGNVGGGGAREVVVTKGGGG